MQLLLSCAKTMLNATTLWPPFITRPHFKDEADRFAFELAQWSVDELKKALHCSSHIASETKLRYLRFFDKGQELPAIFSYFGQVFKNIDVKTFTSEDFRFAQSHLWITSYLYGLLRPMDMIHPYRLEGEISLNATEEKKIFEFWKRNLTNLLLESVKADDGILVYLASEEMKQLFDWKRIAEELHIIQPRFYVMKNGELSTIVVYTKTCRGAMAQFFIRNRIQCPKDLMVFEYEGFTYSNLYGDERNPNFIIL